MDGEPTVEPLQLDSFSILFPLPYRVALIIVLAVWGWAINLHYLSNRTIDVPRLIRYPQRPSAHHVSHHASTYRLAAVLTATFLLSIAAFWLFSHRDPTLVLYYDWMPMNYLVVLAVMFVLPLRSLFLSHSGRSRLLATLRRISIGGLAKASDGKFGDILLADVLTSYSKVMADLFVSICMMFFSGPTGSATDRPDRKCGGRVLVPLITALPFLIRFRQCLIEFVRVRAAPFKESGGWGGKHLANATKYATAFPVIVLAAMQRNLPDTPEKAPERAALFRAWVVASVINSLYSFYWDVAQDWDLTLFSSKEERTAPDHAYGLRKRLMIGNGPATYYYVIALDLMLRSTYALKLRPELDHISEFEGSIFLIQVLEVFRRWIWIFFRVETEWLRSNNSWPEHYELVA